jgi:hypothetical protein
MVLIDHMRAGHTSLKGSLNRFSIASTAKCECFPQMKEHVFWDCKLYEVKRATMIDMLFEESKKECCKSVKHLLKLQEKLLHKQNFKKFFKKEKVQNINNIIMELSIYIHVK